MPGRLPTPDDLPLPPPTPPSPTWADRRAERKNDRRLRAEGERERAAARAARAQELHDQAVKEVIAYAPSLRDSTDGYFIHNTSDKLAESVAAVYRSQGFSAKVESEFTHAGGDAAEWYGTTEWWVEVKRRR